MVIEQEKFVIAGAEYRMEVVERNINPDGPPLYTYVARCLALGVTVYGPVKAVVVDECIRQAYLSLVG